MRNLGNTVRGNKTRGLQTTNKGYQLALINKALAFTSLPARVGINRTIPPASVRHLQLIKQKSRHSINTMHNQLRKL